MAHMFKGPGALTSGSVIADASNISVIDLTINNASDNTVEIVDDVFITGDLTTQTGDIIATSITANIKERVTTLLTTSSGTNYGSTIDVSNTNVLYFADTTQTATVQLTAILTWPTISNGHRLFIAWTNRGSTQSTAPPSLRIDFGASKLYSSGISGPTHRYLLFTGLAQHSLLYYSSVLNAWICIESNNAGTSANP